MASPLTVPQMHTIGVKAAQDGDFTTAEAMRKAIFRERPGSSYGLEVMEAVNTARAAGKTS